MPLTRSRRPETFPIIPIGDVAANKLQDAIAELDAEKLAIDAPIAIGVTNRVAQIHIGDTLGSLDRGARIDQYGDFINGAQLAFKKARGLESALTPVVLGDYVGVVGACGYSGVDYLRNAGILFRVDGIPTNTSVPGAIDFCTGSNGEGFSGFGNTRLTITATGHVLTPGFQGIGTATPLAQVHINTSNYSLNRGAALHHHSANVTASVINFRKSRGSEAAPQAVISGDFTGIFGGAGYSPSGAYVRNAGIVFRVDGAPSGGNVPGAIDFCTGQAGEGSAGFGNVRGTFTPAGRFGLNTATPGATQQIFGSFAVASSAAAVADPGNGNALIQGDITVGGFVLKTITWTTLTLSNGWAGTIQYAKNAVGLVLISGILSKPNTAAQNQVITTLPAGFRSDRLRLIPSIDSSANSKPCFQIQPNGNIEYINLGAIPGNTANLSMDVIRYLGV